MEKAKLIDPTMEYEKEILAYKEEFLAADSTMDGCGPLRKYDKVIDWITINRKYMTAEQCPEGIVPQRQYIYVRESDRKVIGMLQVRLYLNDYLLKYAGNIGYSIVPSERRKGYAKQILADGLEICKELGMEKVLVSCKDTNEASRKTILHNGGKYDGTNYEPDRQINLERYWINLEN